MTPLQRKRHTEKLLKVEKVPVNKHLPCLSSESETRFRSPREVGIRLLCLFCVAGTAFDISNDAWKRYLKDRKFWEHLSPSEKKFIVRPSQSVAMQLTWRCEAMFVLLWALGRFEELPLPRFEASGDAVVDRLPALNEPPEPFLDSLVLRPKEEILNACDLVYRLHWAVRDAALGGRSAPSNLRPSIIQEWHLALNWLRSHQDAEWDEVPTDT